MSRTVNYITEADFRGLVTPDDWRDRLDDDSDGVADAAAVTSVIETACDAVDTYYKIRGVPVPLDVAVEPLAKSAAIYLAVETLWTRRRQSAENSPCWEMIKEMRRLLGRVAAGTQTVPSLAVGAGRAVPEGQVPGDGAIVSVVSEPARTRPRRAGRIPS